MHQTTYYSNLPGRNEKIVFLLFKREKDKEIP